MSHEIVPQTPILNKQTYSAPMSYIGSTRRILPWASRPRPVALAITVWTTVILGLILIWALITCWYLLWGIFLVPYRLIRRQQRKALHVQRAQLAAMQTFMAGQMKQPPEPGPEQRTP